MGNHLRGGTGFPDQAWERAAKARHRGRLNVVFCDGHAEGNTLKFQLYDMTDTARRRWNNDHKAHLELY